jgi:RNA polymerase sigma-70 factor (ECF subfamily)
VELYQHRVFNLVQMALRDRAAAEDIVQDAFIRAYTHLDMFDPERDFYPWLATIAMRLAYNCKRRAGEFVSDNANSHQNVATDSCLLEGVLVDERAQRLWHAVSALPSGERMAVVMFYRQDMKVEEIAQALGVTSGTVKTFLFRARAKLRCSMRGDASSDDPMEPSK